MSTIGSHLASESSIDGRIDRYFGGGDLVIDLGCGDGAWIDSVRSRYVRAVGIDVSNAALTAHGGVVQDWDFIQVDLNLSAVPLDDESADAVRANQVIEHVANPMQFVTEAIRVLRPGGVFVATTPNVRYLRHLLRLAISGRGPMTSGEALRTAQVWDDGHIHYFTAGDLEWIARSAGFLNVRTEALISPTGRARFARGFLNQVRTTGIVKGFLGGNVMVVGWK